MTRVGQRCARRRCAAAGARSGAGGPATAIRRNGRRDGALPGGSGGSGPRRSGGSGSTPHASAPSRTASAPVDATQLASVVTLPADLLAALLAADGTRPRLTSYDDPPARPTASASSCPAGCSANWVAKAGNCCRTSSTARPRTTVGLELPGALARVLLGPGRLVGRGHRASRAGRADARRRRRHDRPRSPSGGGDGGLAVLVTLPDALARPPRHPVRRARRGPRAGHLRRRLRPWEEPDPDDPGLVAGDVTTAYGRVVVPGRAGGRARGSACWTGLGRRSAVPVGLGRRRLGRARARAGRRPGGAARLRGRHGRPRADTGLTEGSDQLDSQVGSVLSRTSSSVDAGGQLAQHQARRA